MCSGDGERPSGGVGRPRRIVERRLRTRDRRDADQGSCRERRGVRRGRRRRRRGGSGSSGSRRRLGRNDGRGLRRRRSCRRQRRRDGRGRRQRRGLRDRDRSGISHGRRRRRRLRPSCERRGRRRRGGLPGERRRDGVDRERRGGRRWRGLRLRQYDLRPRLRRQQAERVDVALRIGRAADPELDEGRLGAAAVGERADGITLGDDGVLPDADLTEVRERHRPAVGGLDRDGLAVPGDGPGERDGTRSGRAHRFCRGAADVDAAMLAGGVRVCGIERVRREYATGDGPAPRLRRRRVREHGDEDEHESTHEHTSLSGGRTLCSSTVEPEGAVVKKGYRVVTKSRGRARCARPSPGGRPRRRRHAAASLPRRARPPQHGHRHRPLRSRPPCRVRARA